MITLARTPFFSHSRRDYTLALTRCHRAHVCALAPRSSITLYRRNMDNKQAFFKQDLELAILDEGGVGVKEGSGISDWSFRESKIR